MVYGKKRLAARFIGLLLGILGMITVLYPSDLQCCAADENEMTEIPIFPDQPEDSTEGGQKGDVNEDGIISMEDAVCILNYYARRSAGLEAAFSENATENARRCSLADCNADGIISIEDVSWVLTYYARAAAGF